MLDLHSDSKNVHGLERAGSLAGGALMVSKGLRQGGFLGLLQLAVGGLALARGFSGHCAAKSWLHRQTNEMHGLRADIEDSADKLVRLKDKAVDTVSEKAETGADKLSRLKEKAVDAVSETTVTGNETLSTPKL